MDGVNTKYENVNPEQKNHKYVIVEMFKLPPRLYKCFNHIIYLQLTNRIVSLLII